MTHYEKEVTGLPQMKSVAMINSYVIRHSWICWISVSDWNISSTL